MAKMAETVLSEDLILEQLESSMARGINIVATEENLFAIHSKIQKHLKNEKSLTKTEILKLVTFLNKMECSGERLTVISQYAEQVLFNILAKQSQGSFSQLATSNSTVTQNNLEHANNDGTPKSNTFGQIFRTESNLFPTQSSDSNPYAAEASRNYTEPVQNEDVSINSYNLNSSAMLVLNLDGNNEVSDNTIYLPSQLLTNNNFVEDTTRAQYSQNKDVTEQDKFSGPELIEFENGNTIDNDDLTEINTFALNNAYDSTETFKSSQEIISNSMRIINRISSETSEESIVFDINPENTTGKVNDQVTNDIKKLSDKMKTSIVLNDSEDIIDETPLIIDETPLITDETPLIIDETPLIIDETPLIIDETPSISLSQQTRTRSYTQSKSFLNFYKSSLSKSNICKRRKVKKFEKTSIFKNVMGKSNIEMMPDSQSISELSSDPKDITPPGNELINNSSTISSDQTINSSSAGSSRSNLSLNRVVINGSEVTNDQASAQRNNEAIQAEKVLKMIKEQRNKYREKWDTMSVKEKVNAKFVKKFQINIFEDPVDSLLNIDYETNPNNLYYKRVTKDEMNEILKSHNIEFLTSNLKESIRDAFNDAAAKANKENMESYSSSDEDKEEQLNTFVERAKTEAKSRMRVIQKEWEDTVMNMKSSVAGSMHNEHCDGYDRLAENIKQNGDYRWLLDN